MTLIGNKVFGIGNCCERDSDHIEQFPIRSNVAAVLDIYSYPFILAIGSALSAPLQ